MSSARNSVNTFQRPHHRGWLLAVLGTLLLQSLFPSGYMPTNLKDGWVAMLCPDGLPAAFVQQLGIGHEAPAQSDAHAHHHAHPAVHGSTEAGDGPQGGHGADMSMGSCQLGSAMDQPVDLATVEPEDVRQPPASPPQTPEQVWVAAAHLAIARSRAPPIS